jgi:hypothetical protein
MMEPRGVGRCGAIGPTGYQEPAQVWIQWLTILLLKAIT